MLFLYVICLLKFPDSKLWTWHFGSAVLLEFQVGTKTPFSRTSKTFSLQWYAAGQSNCWAFTVDSFSRETKLSNHKMTMVCKIWGFRPSHNASPQSSNDSFKHFKVSFQHTASKHRKKVQKLKYFIGCPNNFRMIFKKSVKLKRYLYFFRTLRFDGIFLLFSFPERNYFQKFYG